MANTPQAAVEAGDTLENLVNQFTDPYACLRELIQNSMDAGSTSVSVDFEFKPYEDKQKGIMVIRVTDTGEGMDRTIIDTKLTQLFSSSKENDLTKIGKFGIGFVSVFALDPAAVIVDTGRDGEYWRIFFKKDRTFDRIVLDNPVEGTEIQIIKEVTPEEFEYGRKRSRDTIIYWCKHTEAEIYVEDDLINQEFDLDNPYAYRHTETDTEIVLAPSAEQRPYFGFYNRGLTLKEGQEEFIPGVQFKIKSRYLEHTLTRDNVLEDEHYHKAMEILAKTVKGPFRNSLFKAASQRHDDKLFGYLVHRLDRLPKTLANLPILPLLNGQRLSINDFKSRAKRKKEVFWEAEASELTRMLENEKEMPVMAWHGPDKEPGLGALLETLAGKYPLRRANSSWALPQKVKVMDRSAQELLACAGRILNRAGSPYRELVPSRFDYPGSPVSDEIYLESEKAGALLRVDGNEKGFRWPSFLFGKARGKVLLLNVTHELIEPHFRLVNSHPTLAAYLLAKAVTIDDGLPPETEAKLVEAALDEEGLVAAS